MSEKLVHQAATKGLDGGYGWVVCVVAFLISMVCDGIVHSYGVFVPAIMEKFMCSSGSAALIGSLQTGVTYFVALLIFAATNTCGCRYVKNNLVKLELHGKALECFTFHRQNKPDCCLVAP